VRDLLKMVNVAIEKENYEIFWVHGSIHGRGREFMTIPYFFKIKKNFISESSS
jgi:hypothetical protein